MLKCNGKDIKGATVCISGAGNVAIYATQKATELGAKVVTLSDSTGWVYDAEGIDLDAVKEIKEVKRGRLSEYKNYRPNAEYHEGKFDWSVKCDVALPCATQNELNADDAKRLIANGCYAVAEGANMPTTLEVQSSSRRQVYSSLRVRQLTQAVLLLLLLRCHRTHSAFHGHLRKLTLSSRTLWLIFSTTLTMLLRSTAMRATM